MTSSQFGRKLFLALTFSDLVQRLHEVTSRQIGEKCQSAISLVPKLGTSLIEGIYKIKMRILACGQTGHWWSNEKISEQRNIGEIFYAYTNWQAVQTCTGLLIFAKSPSDVLQKLLIGATSPNPLRTPSCDGGYSLYLSVFPLQLLDNLARSENTSFEGLLRRNLHRSKNICSASVDVLAFPTIIQ